jgi:AcrR family transcriptional regulator
MRNGGHLRIGGMPPPTPTRRTQAERRATTIAAILDAAISAIAEVGYAHTTVQEIAQRAGVSQGALFRHFNSRLDIIAHAAEEVGERQIRQFGEVIKSADAEQPPAAQMLATMRSIARQPEGAVWDELLVNARSDEALRERITPSANRYFAALLATASELPALAKLDTLQRLALVAITVTVFSGEARISAIAQLPGMDDAVMELLRDFAAHIGVP